MTYFSLQLSTVYHGLPPSPLHPLPQLSQLLSLEELTVVVSLLHWCRFTTAGYYLSASNTKTSCCQSHILCFLYFCANLQTTHLFLFIPEAVRWLFFFILLYLSLFCVFCLMEKVFQFFPDPSLKIIHLSWTTDTNSHPVLQPEQPHRLFSSTFCCDPEECLLKYRPCSSRRAVPFFVVMVTILMVMVWFGFGTKATWLGLGKDGDLG